MGTAPMGARFVSVEPGPACPIHGYGDPWSGALYPGAPVKINTLEEGSSVSDTWEPGPEWLKYDGSNGEEIAAAMTERRPDADNGGDRRVEVNAEHAGPALSLNDVRVQIMRDRWRVPVGYLINPSTGECRNAAGVPQDFDALTAED